MIRTPAIAPWSRADYARRMALTAADCRVDDDIRIAETLPAAAFTDTRFLDAELETVFRASWQVLPERSDDPRPLDEQVASRGSRVPVTLLGRPLFLQRGWDDDTLRLFPNTCTHAWYPLVLGAGKRVFADGAVPLSLRLSGSAAHASGVVHLTYEPVGDPTYGTMGEEPQA